MWIKDEAVSGKAVEVARSAAGMGGQVLAPVLASAGEEVTAASAWAADRLTVEVHAYEPADGNSYTEGPAIAEADWKTFADAIVAAAEANAGDRSPWVILAGSLPPGAPVYAYQELIPRVQATGMKVAIDLRGEVLGAAMTGGPDLVRIDASHAGQALGRKILSQEDAVWAAGMYDAGRNGRVVVVTGTMGVILVEGDGGTIHTQVPKTPVDADALLASLTMTMTGGIDGNTALMLSIGAATR